MSNKIELIVGDKESRSFINSLGKLSNNQEFTLTEANQFSYFLLNIINPREFSKYLKSEDYTWFFTDNEFALEEIPHQYLDKEMHLYIKTDKGIIKNKLKIGLNYFKVPVEYSITMTDGGVKKRKGNLRKSGSFLYVSMQPENVILNTKTRVINIILNLPSNGVPEFLPGVFSYAKGSRVYSSQIILSYKDEEIYESYLQKLKRSSIYFEPFSDFSCAEVKRRVANNNNLNIYHTNNKDSDYLSIRLKELNYENYEVLLIYKNSLPVAYGAYKDTSPTEATILDMKGDTKYYDLIIGEIRERGQLTKKSIILNELE